MSSTAGGVSLNPEVKSKKGKSTRTLFSPNPTVIALLLQQSNLV
jgi:hypothetical protein